VEGVFCALRPEGVLGSRSLEDANKDHNYAYNYADHTHCHDANLLLHLTLATQVDPQPSLQSPLLACTVASTAVAFDEEKDPEQ
jgi:hypothetical protein